MRAVSKMDENIDGFLPENLLDIPRESGDGDSGAECKETAEDSPLTTRKDFLDITDALTNITREVQGAEKPKDIKKTSKIPVRMNRPKTLEKNQLSDDKNSLTASPVSDEDTFTESLTSSKMDQKWREIKALVEEEDYSLLEEAYLDTTKSDSHSDLNISDFQDINRDLSILPSMQNENSSEISLSPRAPLATVEEETPTPSPTSDDFTMEEMVLDEEH